LTAIVVVVASAVGLFLLLNASLANVDERVVWSSEQGASPPGEFMYLAFPTGPNVISITPTDTPSLLDRAVLIGQEELDSAEPFEAWLGSESAYYARADITFLPPADEEAHRLIESYNAFIGANPGDYDWRRIACTWTRTAPDSATVELTVVDSRGRHIIYVYKVAAGSDPTPIEVRRWP
jgi:hypothetical protein